MSLPTSSCDNNADAAPTRCTAPTSSCDNNADAAPTPCTAPTSSCDNNADATPTPCNSKTVYLRGRLDQLTRDTPSLENLKKTLERAEKAQFYYTIGLFSIISSILVFSYIIKS